MSYPVQYVPRYAPQKSTEAGDYSQECRACYHETRIHRKEYKEIRGQQLYQQTLS